jgi:hypothetical protein
MIGRVGGLEYLVANHVYMVTKEAVQMFGYLVLLLVVDMSDLEGLKLNALSKDGIEKLEPE